MEAQGDKILSKKADIVSVGPLVPDAMGRRPCGSLCIFLRKYIN